VTVDTPQPAALKFDNIAAFWEDGITTSSAPTEGTSYGLWKKIGPTTYFTKIVQVNGDGTFGTIKAITTLTGDTMAGTFQGTDTDLTGTTVSAPFSGRVTDTRITAQSTP
jgi:hypothetical protein